MSSFQKPGTSDDLPWHAARLLARFPWVLAHYQYLPDICALTPKVLTAVVPVEGRQETPFPALMPLTDGHSAENKVC